MTQESVKQRDVAIDLVKVIATLLVLNSHMGMCYGPYSALATGGGIGDALFFFVSGFTLFLGRKIDFFNWYKRRIGRIFPTVLAVGLFAGLLLQQHVEFLEVMLVQKYWFLQCILVSYVFIFPVWRYEWNIYRCILVSILLISFSYFMFFDFDRNLFYGVNSSFRWIFYFSIMLIGGGVCKEKRNIKYAWYSLPMTLLSVVAWYGVNYLAQGTDWVLLSYIPLVGVCVFVYQTGKSAWVEKIFAGKVMGNLLFIVGNLCLESYLIQKYLFTDALNGLFPLNVPLIMIIVLLAAYLVRILANVIAQVFDSKPLDWRQMILTR